jgi:cellobionic acid phosphorylase
MLQPTHSGERYQLTSPTSMPRAAGFLWNQRMMIQVTCRGYAVAQFMQPEPAKYAYAPNLEAKTFMQPEQPYYAHHPGRFFYIKDEETGEFFSAPYEPVRAPLSSYSFSVGKSDLQWQLEWQGVQIDLKLSLPTADVVELWECKLRNVSGRTRKLSI